ncbi:MAG: hypothetical protein LBH44_02960 [Treponema sp.]|jgi:hypothetical protein|nr:hypothetical protein [Treponema sp.]
MKKEHGFSKVSKIVISVLVIALALLAVSCATKSDVYKEIDHAVEGNNFDSAIQAIINGQDAKKPIYPEKNSIMLYLDKGMLEHYAGKYAESSTSLQEAERLIDDAYTKSVSADLFSYIANDNTKEFPGEDFENIYLNVFNALNYYKSGNLESALVEIRKLSMSSGKLDMLVRKYEEAGKSFGDKVMEQLNKIGFTLSDALPQPGAINFSKSALAHYLSALFFLGDGNTDSARIEFDQVQAAFDSNKNIYKNDVPNAVADARSVPAGKGRLNVIGFAGLSPVKEEGLFEQVWPFMQNVDLQTPIFKLPVFKDRPSAITGVKLTVGDESVELELIEDMGAVMKETFAARFSNLFFKTYIRVLLKYATADIAATQSGGGRLAALLAKKALDATEGADIRMSRYLPSKAYIGGINLDPGNYTARIDFMAGGSVAAHVEKQIEVKAGTLNLLDAVSLK